MDGRLPIVEFTDEYAWAGVHFWVGCDSTGASLPGSLFVNVREGENTSHPFHTQGSILTNNQWNFVAVAYDYNSGDCKLYANGRVQNSANLGQFIPKNYATMHIGKRPSTCPDGGFLNFWFTGGIDEVEVCSRALQVEELDQIYYAGAAGKCKDGPPPPTQCVTPPAGLVGWWSGVNHAEDISGASHHGTANNIAYDPDHGLVGPAFALNGDTSSVTVPESPGLTLQSFTIDA